MHKHVCVIIICIIIKILTIILIIVIGSMVESLRDTQSVYCFSMMIYWWTKECVVFNFHHLFWFRRKKEKQKKSNNNTRHMPHIIITSTWEKFQYFRGEITQILINFICHIILYQFKWTRCLSIEADDLCAVFLFLSPINATM